MERKRYPSKEQLRQEPLGKTIGRLVSSALVATEGIREALKGEPMTSSDGTLPATITYQFDPVTGCMHSIATVEG